jgi:hypothetical protein
MRYKMFLAQKMTSWNLPRTYQVCKINTFLFKFRILISFIALVVSLYDYAFPLFFSFFVWGYMHYYKIHFIGSTLVLLASVTTHNNVVLAVLGQLDNLIDGVCTHHIGRFRPYNKRGQFI